MTLYALKISLFIKLNLKLLYFLHFQPILLSEEKYAFMTFAELYSLFKFFPKIPKITKSTSKEILNSASV